MIGSAFGSFRVEQAGCLRAVFLTIFAVVMLIGPPFAVFLSYVWDDDVEGTTRQLEELKQDDPIADAEQALANRERIYVSIVDKTRRRPETECPGLRAHQLERLVDLGYRSRSINLLGVSYPTGRQQRLNESARRYALLYNQHVWHQVSSPSSERVQRPAPSRGKRTAGST